MLQELRARSVKPVTLLRDSILIGDPTLEFENHPRGFGSLDIKIWAYAKVTETKLPSAKKYSKLVKNIDNEEAMAKGEVTVSTTYKVVQPVLQEGDEGETNLLDDVELDKVFLQFLHLHVPVNF